MVKEINNDTVMENAGRLQEIKEQLENLLGEADELIRHAVGHDDIIYRRAESYWLAHATGAISKDTRWLGGSMFTMEETILELEALVDECDTETDLDEEEED